MKPSDLVRINLPERARDNPSYYYHDYVGLIVDIVTPTHPDLPGRTAAVLVDGMERVFSEKYLEVISEAG